MSRLSRPGAFLAALWLVAASASLANESAEKLLARSIAYHDPEGIWQSAPLALEISESRPDGDSRTTRIGIDVGRGSFDFQSERQGRRVEARVIGADCRLRIDGAEPGVAEAEELGYSCERLQRIRNYYVYLWGLPMKLRDPGTILDPEVTEGTFNGLPVKTLRVTYDQEVGGDTWYFHLDPESAALVGYRFYHDESANDGEYIVLDGEVAAAGLRLPKTRTWYTHGDEKLLGSDALESLRRSDPSVD